jgi:hypothetical protein
MLPQGQPVQQALTEAQHVVTSTEQQQQQQERECECAGCNAAELMASLGTVAAITGGPRLEQGHQ